jgi:hypothetical protein
LYSQRRQAQLAADAGALAGARARCDPKVTQTPADAANTYVTNNHAEMKSFTLGPGEMEVTVETSITFDTFFLHILGRPQLTAEAIAAAKCEAGGGAAVLPVAWSCKPPDIFTGTEGLEPTCELDFGINEVCEYPDDPDSEEWDKFYIVIDSDDLGESMYCAEHWYNLDWGPNPEGFNCSMCEDTEAGDVEYEYCHSEYPKCDVNCDGTTDVEILSESSFGWLDLDGNGSDANELSDWCLGEGDPYVEIHHWYAGKSGVAVSVFDTVGDHLIGKTAVVPVFDHFCHGVPGYDNDECEWHPDETETATDTVVLSGGTFDDYFHVIGFANYLITCVEAGSHKDCKFHDLLGLPPNVKTIEGCFIQGVDPDITGYGGQDFEAYTLRLSR